ncbi:hypothetical protein ZOSMA_22G00710 [Zostera marina]|uniref:C2H2-type domain-containing protein n=1 Tax=Zostera marina TaxID=29655 RepID=A0A0K9PIL1_ZOSMR|nr:hypothetical protein ZOSMA_22G00710 [Zostera marina]
MKRHVDDFHNEDDSQLHCHKETKHVDFHNEEDFQLNRDKEVKEHKKNYTCPEFGCGKSFKYPSKLKKHNSSHSKSTEVICSEDGCMKSFSNKNCLKEHMYSCHRFIKCHVCETQQLKKNFKRHQRIHEQSSSPTEMLRCFFEGCCHKFSNKSNLKKHVKAVHLQERPFVCHFSGCGKKFPFKHVRDNHEKSGIHVYVPADEEFRQHGRGGRKRICPDIESLFRKRVDAPSQTSALDDPQAYLRWLLDED